MFNVSNRTGPVDYGEEPRQNRNTAGSAKNPNKELIARANAVPISKIFKIYGIRVSEYRNNITCPFKFHKNGQERTPSFSCILDTNSFYCHGCGTGGLPVNFVLNMDGTDREKAARKILELFSDDVDDSLFFDGPNVNERIEIMVDFSRKVLGFRQNNETEHASRFIEYVCWVYDKINLLHTQDNDNLRDLNFKLIDWIDEYNEDINLVFEKDYLDLMSKNNA